MASILARLRPRRPPKLDLVQVPVRPEGYTFQRNPPFWAKWALVLISLDVMVSTSAMEITWNSWAQPVPKDAPPGTKPELQPYWKRSAGCVLHFMTGIMIAGSLLGLRSRLVRSVTVAPPSSKVGFNGNRIYIQTASNPHGHGVVVPAQHTKVVTRNERQLLLEVKDNGKWLLDLRKATVLGKPAPGIEEARQSILRMLRAPPSKFMPVQSPSTSNATPETK